MNNCIIIATGVVGSRKSLWLGRVESGGGSLRVFARAPLQSAASNHVQVVAQRPPQLRPQNLSDLALSPPALSSCLIFFSVLINCMDWLAYL